MQAAAAETGGLARGVQAGQRLAVMSQHAARQVGFQPAQLLEIEAPEKREAVKVSFT